MGGRCVPSHIIYTKKNMTNIKSCKIYVTVGNGHKMKCDKETTLNMNLQGRATVKLTEVLYVPQAVNNILSVSMIILKRATMGATKEKMTIKEGGVNMALNARK